MIQHKIGDLFESGADVIMHQVNCRGVMGSGVARQVRERFPSTYIAYTYMCRMAEGYHLADKLLGQALVRVERMDGREVWVANLFAQLDYGYDGKCYTDYDAFRKSLQYARAELLLFNLKNGRSPTIAIPYRIGCDRGGGDWDTIRSIIEEELRDYDVAVWELPRSQWYKMARSKNTQTDIA